jgi:hypothetical protein
MANSIQVFEILMSWGGLASGHLGRRGRTPILLMPARQMLTSPIAPADPGPAARTGATTDKKHLRCGAGRVCYGASPAPYNPVSMDILQIRQ